MSALLLWLWFSLWLWLWWLLVSRASVCVHDSVCSLLTGRYDANKTKEERMAVKAIDKTCMRHHLELWRESFLNPLYDQLGEEFAARAEEREQRQIGSSEPARVL